MKTIRKNLLLALVAVASSWAGIAQAQDFKIGIVNTDRILRDSNVAKTAQAKLESEFLKREKELNDAINAFKGTAEKFERDAPTMAETQRVAKQKQLIEQDRDLKRRQREFQEDLGARKNEENQMLFEKAGRAVKQVAESEKYDLILQDAAYFNPKHDITEKVIKALNASVGK
ncbi:MAG: OmpH family outer membrane protein [Limnohabitans sp.]|jgi:outer membrane protein|nr:OmpH family outer membrane protein [Limnohabitans sp.]